MNTAASDGFEGLLSRRSRPEGGSDANSESDQGKKII